MDFKVLRTITMTAVMIATTLIFVALNSPAAHATPPTDDACALRTQARVSDVLGVSVGTGQPVVTNIPGRPTPTVSKVCGWAEPGKPTSSAKRVVLTIITAQSFTNGKTPIEGITKTPLSGVGEDAYDITTPGLGTGLNVLKGSFALQVRVYGFSPDQIKAMEKTLAESALGKL